MFDIILASKSKARAELLKQIGLNFKVCIPDVEEKRDLISTPEELVISNAFIKAECVARKFKSGIIIAADTVVLSGNKIIGKPSNIREAHSILRELSRRSHSVYSGLVLINISKKLRETAYEKTEVFMRELSDREIENYFKIINPLDKAGGFDIQGLGAAFINHIDGCFYNVVGLPLSRLAEMLDKMGQPVI